MLHQRLEQLQQLNLVITRQCELSDAIIPEFNAVLDRLQTLRLIPETVILHGVMHQSSYNASEYRDDSAQIFEAALMMPGGFGIVIWDVEEYVTRNAPGFPLVDEARLNFLPFDRCPPALRGLLLPHIGPMLEQFCRSISLDQLAPPGGAG